MPVGLEVEGGEALFSLSTETPVYPFDIPGDPDHVLEGVLTDNLGRREIRYTTRADGSFEVVAAADFNLPPAGVRAASGLVAVCWNRLGGPDSPLTAGEMPDPTRGVQLLCRIRGEDGWGEVVAAGGEARAAWLSDVGVADDGTVSLDYYRDDGWFIPTRDPLHGRYRQTLRAGVLSEAVQLEGPGGF